MHLSDDLSSFSYPTFNMEMDCSFFVLNSASIAKINTVSDISKFIIHKLCFLLLKLIKASKQ